MDMISFRRFMLERNAAIRGVGLEIGAFARPTVTQTPVRFLDFYSTEELRVEALKHGIDPEDVVPVDYIARGEDYRNAVDRQFDFIIANHVFEHIVDPVAWLKMLGDLLNRDGYLLLTIPDRTERCFDRHRPLTSFSHIMWDYLSDLTYEQKAWVHAVDTNIYYDRAFINQSITPEKLFDIENMKRAKHHPGVHCHVFQGATFDRKIMKPLLHQRIVDYTLVDYEPQSPWGEFYVVLRKGWTPFPFSLEEFYTRP